MDTKLIDLSLVMGKRTRSFPEEIDFTYVYNPPVCLHTAFVHLFYRHYKTILKILDLVHGRLTINNNSPQQNFDNLH